tara:strand:+ start:186 stop:389 length:204 start_codon:yes stop_codon:yes gene_type:complete
MWHMIRDNLAAYVRAKEDTTRWIEAQKNLPINQTNWAERNNLKEEEQRALDGLMSVIRLAINEGNTP